MTEPEWLACADPTPMLQSGRSKPRKRKLRLLCCACCRRLWPLLSPESRYGVGVAELDADGRVSRPDLIRANAKAHIAVSSLPRTWSYEVLRQRYAATAAFECTGPHCAATPGAVTLITNAAEAVSLAVAAGGPDTTFGIVRDIARNGERAAQAGLVREVFGNPFHPVSVVPSWFTSTVLALARGVYEESAYDRLPILADALMDAGCDDEEMLAHCQSQTPHVRGCWAIDLLLGLE